MMQDTLRGSVLASLPFYDRKKVVSLLDRLPAMTDADRIGWEPALLSILSACVIQDRFWVLEKRAVDDTDGLSDSLAVTPRGKKHSLRGVESPSVWTSSFAT
jgi:hypothetical protein